MGILSVKVGRTYLINILVSVIFAYTYDYMHNAFLCEYFGYFGYSKIANQLNVFMTFIIAIFPILFFSSSKTPSNFISIFIYTLVYIPIILTLQYNNNRSLETLFSYQLAFMCSMILLFLSDIGTSNNSIRRNTDLIPVKFWMWFGIIIAIVSLFSVGLSSLKFVALSDVYELRSSNKELTNSGFSAYFLTWIPKVFVPLLLIIGLIRKQKLLIVISIAMAMLVYLSKGSKSALFTPVICLALYYALKNFNFKYFFSFVAGFFILTTIFFVFYGSGQKELFMFFSIIFMRTWSIAGLLTSQYINFFDTNPFTYYSHINIVNYFTNSYPYPQQLGMIIGQANAVGQSDGANANANFWAMDGVAAGGIVTVLISTVILSFVLRFLNKVSIRHDINFVFILLVGATMSFLNVSIFTTLLGSGLFLILIFLRFSDVNK